jgi:hypothetical protein
MAQCQRCFTSRFCSRQCQTDAWAEHKDSCKQMKLAQAKQRISEELHATDSHLCFLYDVLQVCLPKHESLMGPAGSLRVGRLQCKLHNVAHGSI